MTKMKTHVVMGLVALSLIASMVAPAWAASEDSLQRAMNNAHGFLKTGQRGKDVLDYVHFGATYRGHEFVKTFAVNNDAGNPIDGWFALVYRFRWEDDGVTDIAFRCNPQGNVYDVQVTYTNAVLNRPFLFANAAIKVLGNLLIEANKDKMDRGERRLVQKLVDDADAKGLLEWSLKFQQAFGN
jgi:hypothetical protein